jgi:outer membrane protein OmpU
MRKVLLATTALVAMTGAAAAEVTVNGFYEFNYTSTNDDRTSTYDEMGDDTEVHIGFNTTSDNGLAYGMKVEFEGSAASDDTTNVDEASMYISGDFGKITLGENDGAAEDGVLWSGNTHFMGAWGSSVTTENAASTPAAMLVDDHVYYGPGSNAMKVKYNSPSVGGFTFAYSMADKGSTTESEDTEASVVYSMEMGGVGISVSAGMHDSGESSDTNEAAYQFIQVTSGDLTVTGGRSTHDNASDSSDIDTTLIGLDYSVNDQITVSAEYLNSQNGTSGNQDELDATGFGVSYNIAPGLNFDLTHHTYEVTDATTVANNNDGSVTRGSIKVSF